jgi:hypothetical protein
MVSRGTGQYTASQRSALHSTNNTLALYVPPTPTFALVQPGEHLVVAVAHSVCELQKFRDHSTLCAHRQFCIESGSFALQQGVGDTGMWIKPLDSGE